MVSFSSLTTVLDNNLPTFRLDSLVVLKANEVIIVLCLSICMFRNFVDGMLIWLYTVKFVYFLFFTSRLTAS